MARRWFSRKGLTCEAETFDVLVHTYANAKINGSQIFSQGDLTRVLKAAPITLDGGATVTTMTMRGVSTLPANFKVETTPFTVTIPAFSVTVVGAGTITLITLGQTAVKPSHDTVYPITLKNGSAFITGKLVWNATTGNLLLSTATGGTITVNFGLDYDFTLPIN